MLLCQISDLHIKAGRKLAYGIVDTAGMLERCIRQLLERPQQPDAIIVTGDLVDYGTSEEYGLLRELLAPLTMPVYLSPGNHDERGALRAGFPDHGYLRQWEPFIQYTIEEHAVRIVALDTVVPGQSGGALCNRRLEWLDRALGAQPKRPTIVTMHHPPFLTGIGHMDRIGLDDCSGLAQVISRHPQVERVLAGHLHRSITARFAGTVASTCPSPAHQVALDLAQVQRAGHLPVQAGPVADQIDLERRLRGADVARGREQLQRRRGDAAGALHDDPVARRQRHRATLDRQGVALVGAGQRELAAAGVKVDMPECSVVTASQSCACLAPWPRALWGPLARGAPPQPTAAGPAVAAA